METGAFKACANSCAFAPTLPFLVRIFLSASLRLFCLPCLEPDPTACPLVFPHARWLSRRDCHLPPCSTPFDLGKGFGLGVLAEFFVASPSSRCVIRESRDDSGCSKSGNLKVSVRLEEFDHRRSELVEVIAKRGACRLMEESWLLQGTDSRIRFLW